MKETAKKEIKFEVEESKVKEAVEKMNFAIKESAITMVEMLQDTGNFYQDVVDLAFGITSIKKEDKE